MVRYYQAYICKKGHVLSYYGKNDSKYCSICGEEVVGKCANCGSPIRGKEHDEDDSIISISKYKLPYYCCECSKPYPWTDAIISNAIEILSLDESLDQETKDVVINALPDLIVESINTPIAVAKYKKYVAKAGKFVQDGLHQILINVATESIKNSLFG